MATNTITKAPRVPPSPGSAAHRFAAARPGRWLSKWRGMGGAAGVGTNSNGTLDLCVTHPAGALGPTMQAHLAQLHDRVLARQVLDLVDAERGVA